MAAAPLQLNFSSQNYLPPPPEGRRLALPPPARTAAAVSSYASSASYASAASDARSEPRVGAGAQSAVGFDDRHAQLRRETEARRRRISRVQAVLAEATERQRREALDAHRAKLASISHNLRAGGARDHSARTGAAGALTAHAQQPQQQMHQLPQVLQQQWQQQQQQQHQPQPQQQLQQPQRPQLQHLGRGGARSELEAPPAAPAAYEDARDWGAAAAAAAAAYRAARQREAEERAWALEPEGAQSDDDEGDRFSNRQERAAQPPQPRARTQSQSQVPPQPQPLAAPAPRAVAAPPPAPPPARSPVSSASDARILELLRSLEMDAGALLLAPGAAPSSVTASLVGASLLDATYQKVVARVAAGGAQPAARPPRHSQLADSDEGSQSEDSADSDADAAGGSPAQLEPVAGTRARPAARPRVFPDSPPRPPAGARGHRAHAAAAAAAHAAHADELGLGFSADGGDGHRLDLSHDARLDAQLRELEAAPPPRRARGAIGAAASERACVGISTRHFVYAEAVAEHTNLSASQVLRLLGTHGDDAALAAAAAEGWGGARAAGRTLERIRHGAGPTAAAAAAAAAEAAGAAEFKAARAPAPAPRAPQHAAAPAERNRPAAAAAMAAAVGVRPLSARSLRCSEEARLLNSLNRIEGLLRAKQARQIAQDTQAHAAQQPQLQRQRQQQQQWQMQHQQQQQAQQMQQPQRQQRPEEDDDEKEQRQQQPSPPHSQHACSAYPQPLAAASPPQETQAQMHSRPPSGVSASARAHAAAARAARAHAAQDAAVTQQQHQWQQWQQQPQTQQQTQQQWQMQQQQPQHSSRGQPQRPPPRALGSGGFATPVVLDAAEPGGSGGHYTARASSAAAGSAWHGRGAGAVPRTGVVVTAPAGPNASGYGSGSRLHPQQARSRAGPATSGVDGGARPRITPRLPAIGGSGGGAAAGSAPPSARRAWAGGVLERSSQSSLLSNASLLSDTSSVGGTAGGGLNRTHKNSYAGLALGATRAAGASESGSARLLTTGGSTVASVAAPAQIRIVPAPLAHPAVGALAAGMQAPLPGGSRRHRS
jgi:hypothetical protein